MSTEIKFRLLVVFSLACLLGLATQAYFLFDLNQRLSPVEVTDSSIPESIQRRLEAEMAKPDRLIDTPQNLFQNPAFSSDPFARMEQMRRQMDQLFNSWTVDPFAGGMSRPARGNGAAFLPSQPQIEVSEKKDAYVVTLSTFPDQDMEINTEVEDNILSLSGTVRMDNRQSSGSSVFSSSTMSQFSRSIPFPEEVNPLGLYTTQEEDRIVITVPKMMS